ANDPAYWSVPEAERPRRPNPFWIWLGKVVTSTGFRWTIYLLLAGILLFAIYRIIAENNLTGFYRSPAGPGPKEAGEDPIDEDLDGKLRQAIQEKDYRAAVRYLYLGTLRLLREKEWIQYHIESTNQEYVRQLSNLPQGSPFRWLTGAYEKVWYGEFPLGG